MAERKIQQVAPRSRRDGSVSKKEPAAERKPSKSREPAAASTKPTAAVAASKAKGIKAADAQKASRKEPIISGGQSKKSKESKTSNGKPAAGIQVRLARKVNAPEVAPKNLAAARAGIKDVGHTTRQTKPPTRTVTKREADEDKSKRKPAHESRSSSRIKPARERTRTRTISPRESTIAKPPMSTRVPSEPDTNNDYDDETFEDYESDFENDEGSDFDESAEASSSSAVEPAPPAPEEQNEAPREMVSLPEPAAKPISALSRNRSANQQQQQNTLAKPPLMRREASVRDLFEEQPAADFGQPLHQTPIKPIAPVIGEAKRPRSSIRAESVVHLDTAADAKKQRSSQESQAMSNAKRRGFQLLSMMRLDVVNFTLLELLPNQLDSLMTCEAAPEILVNGIHLNPEQIADVENASKGVEKWTQHPPKMASIQEEGDAGVGPAAAGDEAEASSSQHLLSTLERASQKIASSTLLNAHSPLGNNEMDIDSTGLGGEIRQLASTGFKFADNNAMLSGRPAKLLQFVEPAKVISVHEKGEAESELVCVWVPLVDALAPRYVLGSRGGVTCLAVHRSLLLAGADDGTVSLWDLQEPSFNHSTVNFGSMTCVVRSPTFSTALMKGVHVYPIRGLCVLQGEQIASVDQEGEMNVWSVVRAGSGSAGSGCHLVSSNRRNLRSELASGTDDEVTDVATIAERLLVAFDTALVVSVSALSEVGKLKKYPPARGCALGITKLVVSPHKNSPYFMVLDGFGDVRLYHLQNSSAAWIVPSHAMNNLRPLDLSWGKSGLVLLLRSTTNLVLWDVDLAKGQHTQAAACSTERHLKTLVASRTSNQLAISTFDGELLSISIKAGLAGK